MSRKCWDSSTVPFGPHQNSLTYPHLQMGERPAAKWIAAVARMIPSEIREAEAKVSRRITMRNNCMRNVLWEPIRALDIARHVAVCDITRANYDVAIMIARAVLEQVVEAPFGCILPAAQRSSSPGLGSMCEPSVPPGMTVSPAALMRHCGRATYARPD